MGKINAAIFGNNKNKFPRTVKTSFPLKSLSVVEKLHFSRERQNNRDANGAENETPQASTVSKNGEGVCPISPLQPTRKWLF